MIIREGSITNGLSTITGLERTDDLYEGIFVYGANGLPVNALVESIDSDSQVTINNPATDSATLSLNFTTANVGVYLERNCALIDSKFNIDERGDYIIFNYRSETTNISRDRYKSIKQRKKVTSTQYKMRAFPVDFQPNEKALEKAGLREEANVIIYTAMKDWIDLGIDFKDIILDLSHSVILQGETYEIKEKGLSNQFNDIYLNVTFGLFKR